MFWDFLSQYWLVIWFSLGWIANMAAYVKSSNNDKVQLAMHFKSAAHRHMILIMLAFILTRVTDILDILRVQTG